MVKKKGRPKSPPSFEYLSADENANEQQQQDDDEDELDHDAASYWQVAATVSAAHPCVRADRPGKEDRRRERAPAGFLRGRAHRRLLHRLAEISVSMVVLPSCDAR